MTMAVTQAQPASGNGGNARPAIFISHAAPEDNAFTLWLGAKLAALGYEVWADVLRLRVATIGNASSNRPSVKERPRSFLSPTRTPSISRASATKSKSPAGGSHAGGDRAGNGVDHRR